LTKYNKPLPLARNSCHNINSFLSFIKKIMRLQSFQLIILAQYLSICMSFTVAPLNIFQSFNPSIFFKEKDVKNTRVAELKEALLVECRTGNNNRESIEMLINELKEIRPIENTADSPLLQKEWLLVWTTEKEINFFIDWDISDQITQTITKDNSLINDIRFQKGGSLSVAGLLASAKVNDSEQEDENNDLIRTNFKFESATLDLARWGSYNFPPLGKGWFDTVYLDEELRVDTNSRDDILICTPL